MLRLASALALLSMFVFVACAGGNAEAPPPSAMHDEKTEVPGGSAPCTATSCGDCTHEAGCFWCKSSGTCSLGPGKGCEGAVVNDADGC